MSISNFNNGHLCQFIDRILRLKDDQDAIGSDVREVYAEAKAAGYDKTILGQVVTRLRREAKQGPDATDEQDSLIALYLDAYRAGEPSEPQSVNSPSKQAATPIETAANGIQGETASHAGAGATEFDPVTGEIMQ